MIATIMFISVLALIAMVYSLISDQTLSRPHILLTIGLVTCGASALVLVVLDGMQLLPGQTESAPFFKLLSLFSTLSIAALGGSIIGGAFMQKAQIAHKTGLRQAIQGRDALQGLLEIKEAQVQQLQQHDRSPEDERLLADLIEITVKWRGQLREISEEIDRRQHV